MSFDFKIYQYMHTSGSTDIIADAKLPGELEASKMYFLNTNNFRIVPRQKKKSGFISEMLRRFKFALDVIINGYED